MHSLIILIFAPVIIFCNISEAFISSYRRNIDLKYGVEWNRMYRFMIKKSEIKTSTKKNSAVIEQPMKGKSSGMTANNSTEKSNHIRKTRRSATASKSSNVSGKGKLKFEELEEPIYFWTNTTDSLVYNDDGHVKIVQFTVQGNPSPLARHRTFRGFIFNPSAKKQQQFASVVLNMLPSSCFLKSTSFLDSASRSCHNVIPIFKEDETISVKLLCRMKRPKNHFVASIPGPGRLKKSAPNSLLVTRTDVDNLAKFVLDSLNQIIYVDDRQIASLQVFKVYDDGHYCSGATDVIIQSLTQLDLQTFHQNFAFKQEEKVPE